MHRDRSGKALKIGSKVNLSGTIGSILLDGNCIVNLDGGDTKTITLHCSHLQSASATDDPPPQEPGGGPG